MRRTFLKIFLWYWLATSLLGLVLVVTIWSTSDNQGPLWQRDIGNLLAIHGASAVDAFENGGDAALDAYLQRAEPDATIRTFIFDEAGTDVTRRSPPEEIARIAEAARRSGHVEFGHGMPFLVVARPMLATNGQRFVVVAQFAGARRDPPPFPSWLVVRALAVLVTTGVVCYGLAWYLTRRLDRLRAATRALASGDLSVRVAGSLGGRDDLTDLGNDFDDMAERLEAFLASEKRLLQDVSHELRSPLARLGVALELLRKRTDSSVKSELDRIELEAGRLDEMIERILTLSRLDTSVGDEDRFTNVDLAALVADVVADAAFEATTANRRVELRDSAPCEVRGDAALLRSAIENVIRNAVRYTPEASAVEVSLTVNPGKDEHQRTACVSVRDFGPGVPPASLEDVFRPFYRVADSRDRTSGGTGLGLAIVHRAVRHHGGQTVARNADDGGLVIEIRLPLLDR